MAAALCQRGYQDVARPSAHHSYGSDISHPRSCLVTLRGADDTMTQGTSLRSLSNAHSHAYSPRSSVSHSHVFHRPLQTHRRHIVGAQQRRVVRTQAFLSLLGRAFRRARGYGKRDETKEAFGDDPLALTSAATSTAANGAPQSAWALPPAPLPACPTDMSIMGVRRQGGGDGGQRAHEKT